MEKYLFFYYSFYILLLFLLPSVRTYRQTGIKPFVFKSDDSAISYVGKVYKLISAGALMVIVINAFFSSVLNYFIPIPYLEQSVIQIIGMVLMHVSFVIIFIAQINMGNAWRIGIDETNKTELVKKGLFSISRNPIFLGVMLVFVGLFLAVPNAVTFVILILGIVVMQVQVRLEEAFLLQTLGEDYKAYKDKVKRWLF